MWKTEEISWIYENILTKRFKFGEAFPEQNRKYGNRTNGKNKSIASSIGAKNSYWFLVLVYTAFNLAQAVYLYIGFIQGIDKELDEAAIIDGCNDVVLLTKILAPICKPIIAMETIFVFIYSYGELIFSLILLSKPEKYTASRAMLNFTGEHSTDMEPQFAFIVSV